MITGKECNNVVGVVPNSFQANNHGDNTTEEEDLNLIMKTFVFSVQNLWIQQKDFSFTHNNEIPELSTKQEEISCILLGALCHFLSSVAQLLEAVVNIFNQLSACQELSLNVSREIFLQNR